MLDKNWFGILLEEGYRDLPIRIPTHEKPHPKRIWDLYNNSFSNYNVLVDLDILGAAIALHDIGVFYTKQLKHGPESAKRSKVILTKCHFPKDKILPVLTAIEWHDVPEAMDKRTTMESRLLYDLDVIDAFEKDRYLEILVYREMDPFKTPDYVINNANKRCQYLHTSEARKICEPKLNELIKYFERLKQNPEELKMEYERTAIRISSGKKDGEKVPINYIA